MREGFYKLDYLGRTGMGFAVIALDTDMVVGADPFGGVYDGTFQWNERTQLLDVKVKVKVPEGVWVVQGQTAGPGGLEFDAECSFPRAPDNRPVMARTSLGDVAVQISLLRAFD